MRFPIKSFGFGPGGRGGLFFAELCNFTRKKHKKERHKTKRSVELRVMVERGLCVIWKSRMPHLLYTEFSYRPSLSGLHGRQRHV